jgi:hypothetical protein
VVSLTSAMNCSIAGSITEGVAAHRDIALMIEQPVEDVQRVARRGCDHLGVEPRIAIGEMGVELAPGLVAVMRVEAGGIAAETTRTEELAIRRRCGSGAEDRRDSGLPSGFAYPTIRTETGMPSLVIRLSTLHPIFASVR